MQVVLLINLLLNGAINPQTNHIWIVLADRILVVGMLESILELLNLSPRVVLFLLNRVLEVTAQALDFLDLLAEITPQS